jgi:general secretion pathway protein A
MFLDFYGLREQPFGMTPDPAYLYSSRTHGDALTALSLGIKDNRGFLALIAEPGMGKTTLLYQLLDEMRANAHTVFVFQTQCNSREFLQFILQDLNVNAEGMGLVAMHTKLNEILFEEMLSGKRFVLVVDEAQNLDEITLETVRMLSNFETQHTKLLQIVLAGQPQLAAKLAQPRLSQLRQRVAVLAHLEPFTAEETGFYINHRLKVAGFRGDTLFDDPAIELIAQYSQGIPRNINNICYTSLLLSASKGFALANSAMVREAVNRLDMNLLVSEPLDVISSSDAQEQISGTGSDSIPDTAPDTAPGPTANSIFDSTPFVEPVAIFSAVNAPRHSSVPASKAADLVPRRPSPQLTYSGGRAVSFAKWSLRFAAVIGIVLLGLSTPSVLRFANSNRQNTPAKSENSSNVQTNVQTPVDPAAGTTGTATGYDAAPQDTANGQVLTVTAGLQESLKELTVRYIGHYDDQLSQQILSLNPGLKDPEHLEAGQLVRLPLPPGSIRKMNDTAESPAASPTSKPPEGFFNRLTALLRRRK